jgi:hypothetical protein
MVVFAAMQLLTREKRPLHYLMATACLLFAYVQYYLWAVESGHAHVLPPALVSSDIPATVFGTAALYLTALTILHGDHRPVRSYLVYFIPPGLFAVAFLSCNARFSADYLATYGTVPGHYETPLLSALTTLAIVTLLGALAFDLLAAWRLHRFGAVQHEKLFRTQVVYLTVYFLASFVLLASAILADDRLFVVGVVAFGVIATTFTLTCTGVVYGVRRTDRVDRRVRIAEWDESATDLTERLAFAMENDQIYRDPDLNLAALANTLGEEPKRLSYHFNAALDTNFRSYINEVRLRATCRDLS